jgi:hypothetical protein
MGRPERFRAEAARDEGMVAARYHTFVAPRKVA